MERLINRGCGGAEGLGGGVREGDEEKENREGPWGGAERGTDPTCFGPASNRQHVLGHYVTARPAV